MKRLAASLACVTAAAAQPASWAPSIAALDTLYATSDTTVPAAAMPTVGNGFLATQIGSQDIYVSLLYNGYLTDTPSHRARIPSTVNIAAPGTVSDAALMLRNATYVRRSYLDPSPAGSCSLQANTSCSNAGSRVWAEQRWYAHRMLPSVLVMEVELLTDDAAASDYGLGTTSTLSVASAALAAGAPLAMLRLDSNPGPATPDIAFTAVPVPNGSPYSIVNGSTLVAETNTSALQAVAVLTSVLGSADAAQPGMLAVWSSGVTFAFITVIRTSVETAPGDLVSAVQSDYAAAAALASNGTLHSSHIAEWAETLWTAGIESDRRDLAVAINASFYGVLSAIRNDRIGGICPSGLTAGYNGALIFGLLL